MPHDFIHGVVIISSGRVDRYASWFVDDDHIVVFVNDTDRLCGYRRFMAVEGMRNDISILQLRVRRRQLAIDCDSSIYDRTPLITPSQPGILFSCTLAKK